MSNTPVASHARPGRLVGARRTRAANRSGTSQVRPHPADDAPVLVADRVLASLLGEDGVPGVLAGPEQAAVLDPGRRTRRAAGAAPRRSRPGRSSRPDRPDLELERRRPELPAVQDHPAAGLADALAPAVRGHDRAGALRLPGMPAMSNSRARRGVVGRARPDAARHPELTTAASCGNERARSRAVRTDRWTATPSISSDLVVPEPGDVADEHRTGAVPRRRAPRDVHAIQRDVPQRQSVQHGRGLMADRRRVGAGRRGSPRRGGGARRLPSSGRTWSTYAPRRSRPSSPVRTRRPSSSSDRPMAIASRRSGARTVDRRRSHGGGCRAFGSRAG